MSNYNSIKEMFERDVYCSCPAIEELLKLSDDLWCEADNMEDEDGDWKEIFTWFRVSDSLYKVLKEKGEAVLEFDHVHYWGRTTFGRSIYADDIFIEIYEERTAK